APIRQNVDELPPQVVAFARIQCGLRNVFDPLNRLGREMPAVHWPFLIAPGEASQAGRWLLGPDGFLARIRRGGRSVYDGDPTALRAAQELQATDPTGSPVTGLLRRLKDHAALRRHLLVQLLRRDRLC